jgi:tetratricopeptide (TPR) repeat protein
MPCVLLLGALLFSNVNADPKQDYFDAGVQAAKNGNYPVALQHFKNAEKSGLDTPALQYNLAVSYYKLGQYETARKLFSRLTDIATFEQLAYFNLGLIANKQKDEAAAIRWFQRAYRDVSSKKVRMLAKEALSRLGVSARKTRRLNPDWIGFVSSSLAHDSNVALLNDDLVGVADQSDTAVDISSYASRWLKGGMRGGVRMSLGASLQKYSKLSQYDYSQLSARVMRYDVLGDWKMRIGGSWNEIYFDGREYQRIVGADVRGRKNLSGKNQLRMRYKLNRIQATNALYDYLDGWRQQFRVGLQQHAGNDHLRYYYQLELNNRKDRESTAADRPFTSYSPTRHTLRATGWWELSKQWQLRLDARFRYSRYNDDNERLINSILQNERREDSQIRLSARVNRELGRHWDVFAQFMATRNDSTIDSVLESRSYDRSVVKLGVSWFF